MDRKDICDDEIVFDTGIITYDTSQITHCFYVLYG